MAGHTGYAELPLHPGNAPPWLFKRMKKLAGAIAEIIVNEYGSKEFLTRLSDPYWFQAFSCVLGFDWHSSGTTTVTMGALKEALEQRDLGIKVAGGKGKTALNTPKEIGEIAEEFGASNRKSKELIRASKLSAKVDSAAVQDGFTLYHHTFVLSEKADWAVVQQGMNTETRKARRYHWLSFKLNSFVNEPHTAVCSDIRTKTLNMVAKEAEENRKLSVSLVREGEALQLIKEKENVKILNMPSSHWFDTRHYKTLEELENFQPENYEELLLFRGVGPAMVRALALTSELIYGAKRSWRDPAKYSFAFGGKDGVPYPVARERMDSATNFLEEVVRQTDLNNWEKKKIFHKLKNHLS